MTRCINENRRVLPLPSAILAAELELLGLCFRLGVKKNREICVPVVAENAVLALDGFRQLEINFYLRLRPRIVACVHELRAVRFDISGCGKHAEVGVMSINAIDEKRGLAVLRHLEVAELGGRRAAGERVI